jgi:excisionase family DNA binding protein
LEETYLRDKRAAARYLNVSEKTLNDWIYQRRGPRFIKVGGKLVRYRPEDLAAFLESCPSGGGAAA